MAHTAQPGTASSGATTAATDRSFLWRRLHSLTGLVPVGLFLLFHIFENMNALRGAQAYDQSIAKLADLLPVPYFYVLEIGVVLLPLLFHGLYGIFLSFEGSPNVGAYAYRRNYLYLAQRVSGIVVLLFVVFHVASLRVHLTLRGMGAGVPGHAGYVSFADMVRVMADPWILGLYFAGVLAAAFHFANGLSGFLWTWGIAVGERARKASGYLAWAFVALTAIPMIAILWKLHS